MSLFGRTSQAPLAGRDTRSFSVPELHEVLGTRLEGPWPEDTQVFYVAMGCFWGAERMFWQQPGVVVTAAGYMGGVTPNPTYEEACSGLTGHAETVLIGYDPTQTSPEQLLKVFWENHDSTTANRQGNDFGTQYRSAIYWTTPEQEQAARETQQIFAAELARHGYHEATTELRPVSEAGPFYYAEDYHQQYLWKNPGGYCNHGPNGLVCSISARA